MGFGKGFLQASLAIALGASISLGALAQSVTTRMVVAGGSATSVMILPGGTVSIDVRLNTVSAALIGTGFRICQTTPAPNGFFSITGRSFVGSPFDDMTSGTPDSAVLVPPSNLLGPCNGDNLGRTTIGLVGISPATQSNVLAANLTLTSSATTPVGTYTIGVVPGVSFVTDSAVNDYDMSVGTPLTIIVAPPVTFPLAVTKFGTGSGTGDQQGGGNQLRPDMLRHLCCRHGGDADDHAGGWLDLCRLDLVAVALGQAPAWSASMRQRR